MQQEEKLLGLRAAPGRGAAGILPRGLFASLLHPLVVQGGHPQRREGRVWFGAGLIAHPQGSETGLPLPGGGLLGRTQRGAHGVPRPHLHLQDPLQGGGEHPGQVRLPGRALEGLGGGKGARWGLLSPCPPTLLLLGTVLVAPCSPDLPVPGDPVPGEPLQHGAAGGAGPAAPGHPGGAAPHRHHRRARPHPAPVPGG